MNAEVKTIETKPLMLIQPVRVLANAMLILDAMELAEADGAPK